MSEIEERQSVPPFKLFVHGGGTLYRAHSPEFDITVYGGSAETAKDFLFARVRGEAEGIQRRGQVAPEIPDERKKCAALLLQIPEEDIESLFEINPQGEAIPQGPGLK